MKSIDAHHPIRILLVDDDETVHNGLNLFLKDKGHSVIGARSGEQALAHIDAETFDLVISDIRMPSMDGMELLKIIKGRLPHIEVILITGYADIAIAIEALRCGAFDFLPKPFSMHELLVSIGRIQRFRELAHSKDSERQEVEKERDCFFTLTLDMLCIAGFDGYFKRLNPTWTKTLGYSTDELLAVPFIEFVHPDDREATMAETQKLAEGKEVISFENRYRCQDGSYRWFLWAATIYQEKELIYATARDITRRKERETELLEARDLAEAASQAKSQFLASMSHELRTPLNAIIGFSEILRDQTFGPLNDKQSQYAGNIHHSGKHLLQLINDILDLAKIEAGRQELETARFDPLAAVRDVQAIVRSLAAKKDIAIAIESAELPVLEADPTKFKQILYNLLSNAIKFTPAGGRVVVRAEVNGAMRFAVEDSGIGIAAEDQQRVFGTFEQIDSSYGRQQQGTGLGLALTRQLVELHRGRIWVESEGRGQGSTFTFELPLSMDAQGAESSEVIERGQDQRECREPTVQNQATPLKGQGAALVAQNKDYYK